MLCTGAQLWQPLARTPVQLWNWRAIKGRVYRVSPACWKAKSLTRMWFPGDLVSVIDTPPTHICHTGNIGMWEKVIHTYLLNNLGLSSKTVTTFSRPQMKTSSSLAHNRACLEKGALPETRGRQDGGGYRPWSWGDLGSDPRASASSHVRWE